MNRPDFIGIGAQRCGTTSLYNYLTKHDKIAIPKRKEIFYFAQNYDEGEDWYEKHFKKDGINFEICSYYIYHPLAPERLYDYNPDMPLFVLLRNPVDRAYSQFWHEKRVGEEFPSITFEEAIELEGLRLRGCDPSQGEDYEYDHHGYIKRGEYIDQLKRWYKYFPKEQIKIIKSERFFTNTPDVMHELLNWLDVPIKDLSPYEIHYNLDYPEMEESVREKLEEHYKPYNEELYEAIGRKLW